MVYLYDETMDGLEDAIRWQIHVQCCMNGDMTGQELMERQGVPQL